MKRKLGFTIIELMITVGILAILVAIAAPNFSNMVRRNAMDKSLEDLYSSLVLARSESLARARPVTVCPTRNPNDATPLCSAAAADWNTAWIVFVDTNRNGVIDAASGNTPADELIAVNINENSGFMTLGFTGTPNRVTYTNRGLLNTGAGVFTACANSENDKTALRISTGAGRVSYTATQIDGSDLACN